MSKGSETQFEGFDDLLGRFADESVFWLMLFGFVLYLEVHLPAYIIAKMEKRP